MTPDPRLQRLLGGAELSALRLRLRRHFERGGSADGALTLTDVTPHERDVLSQLVGKPARAARSIRLDLSLLEERLSTAGLAASLRDALERLDGPITDLAAQKLASRDRWSAVTERADREPRLSAWLQSAPAIGLLKRLSGSDAGAAEAMLERADAVLRVLPVDGMPRAQLAARTLGDAHSLDAGRPVATLVLAAWRRDEAARKSSAPLAAGGPEAIETAEAFDIAETERIRDIWARAGVLVNELARPVLVLNLPTPDTPRMSIGSPGEPAYLSLRWLLRAAPTWAKTHAPVFVCENPNLLAIAADRLGRGCAPLVCVEGMPAAAQRTLLQRLAGCGITLRYHGDFDWDGIRIANQVVRSAGAQPWRMGAVDYETAAGDAAQLSHALIGAPVEACWDPQLSEVMQRRGLPIAEEAVADSLLGDLVCR